MDASTIVALRASQTDFPSLRQLAGYLGLPAGTLSDALAGGVSHDTENRLRVALGLAPLPALIPVPPCDDCGKVHTSRCHGKPVVSVVVIGPDERVTRKPTRIVRRWRDLPPVELARAIAERVPYSGRNA